MERLTDEIINKYIAEMRVVVDAHKCDTMYRDNMLALIELKQYRDTGLTPEQIRELKERDTAKAPEEIQDAFGDGTLICPHCRNSVINYFNRSRPPQFCMICGQRLQWGEIE